MIEFDIIIDDYPNKKIKAYSHDNYISRRWTEFGTLERTLVDLKNTNNGPISSYITTAKK